MYGAIFGDIVGSVYEFNNIYKKDFPLFSGSSVFTDDSVMTLAVAEAILSVTDGETKDGVIDTGRFKSELVKAMKSIGKSYPASGYGTRFLSWLYSETSEPYGSYGNGSAMRVSPVAWCSRSLDEALVLAKASAEVTHNHPEGIKGAEATAGAIYLARNGATMDEIKDFVKGYYDINFTLDKIRYTYSFNETCQETVPQALEAFFESKSFEDAIRCTISIGGDSDTLAAITGSVAEAFYGMGQSEREAVRSRLTPHLLGILERFEERFMFFRPLI